MELKTVEGGSLMTIRSLRREGGDLVIDGRIMGAVPVQAVLTPTEARRALRLVPGNIWFLLTLLFRR